MGATDGVGDGGATHRSTTISLEPREMEHIRKVYDNDAAGRKFCSIISPREDALMFRNAEKHAVPCECIVELYELLWRWGHRSSQQKGFADNFGFTIPDTVVIVKGRPYAWYFISKKDGALLRKCEEKLSLGAVEKKFCPLQDGGDSKGICAIWYPMASQFPEARCPSPFAEFLSPGMCRGFLQSLRQSHSGILQAFVEPDGVSNFLVRTVQYHNETSMCHRANRSLLAGGRTNLFDRAATFEGWPGLSSSSGHYRNHKAPNMEDLIIGAGETLNKRIEQERVRQMLFLNETQHVALHFKVAKDHMLYFIYASVVSEEDVILQTRPQLLMGDPVMNEKLTGLSLLPGGTERKALPYEFPKENGGRPKVVTDASNRAGSLPPIEQEDRHSARKPLRRRPLSERRRQQNAASTCLPTVSYERPEVPLPPYRINRLPAATLEESGRYEYVPPFTSASLKTPLISMSDDTSSRDKPLISSARSEPVHNRSMEHFSPELPPRIPLSSRSTGSSPDG